MVLAREERPAGQHLRKDAPRTPDIDLDVVLLPCQHDLGGPVVPSRDVAGHLGVLDTSEAKVADLEIAVFVDEDVAWLEVAVDDAGGMHILEASLARRGGRVVSLCCIYSVKRGAGEDVRGSGRGSTG